MNNNKTQASLIDSLIPIVAIIIMLATSVAFYGADSSYGANQIALIIGAVIASLVGFKNGFSWKEIEAGIVKGISTSLGAILILLMVGSLIGAWILAGTVPAMIYYGLQVLNPTIFYAASAVICALVSISIGSSWTTAGTVGVALIGIAAGLNMSPAITAGAIISGAYFGDKMSPLSDTTNLAPAVAGTELFTHIKHMAWTTGPSILIAITIFLLIGFFQDPADSQASLGQTVAILRSQFSISPWSLLPLALVLFMAYRKYPAFLTLLCGALVGGLFAMILQPQAIERSVSASLYQCKVVKADNLARCEYSGLISAEKERALQLELVDKSGARSTITVTAKQIIEDQVSLTVAGDAIVLTLAERSALAKNIDAVWRALFSGYVSDTGDEAVDQLLSRGGMSSMLNTIWLILSAMTFGAVLETIGVLQRLVRSILSMAKSTGSMIASVITTCIGTNIIAADQYIAIVLPGRMYRAEFKRRGLAPKNLSRVLEDSATITSPLIPWNTCGAYMAGALGVPTLVYLPFCFFNLVNPVISVIYGFANFKITPIDEAENDLVEGVVHAPAAESGKGAGDEKVSLS